MLGLAEMRVPAFLSTICKSYLTNRVKFILHYLRDLSYTRPVGPAARNWPLSQKPPFCAAAAGHGYWPSRRVSVHLAPAFRCRHSPACCASAAGQIPPGLRRQTETAVHCPYLFHNYCFAFNWQKCPTYRQNFNGMVPHLVCKVKQTQQLRAMMPAQFVTF